MAKEGDLVKVTVETPRKEFVIGILKNLSNANEFLIYRLELLVGVDIKIMFLNTRQLCNNIEVLSEAG